MGNAGPNIFWYVIALGQIFYVLLMIPPFDRLCLQAVLTPSQVTTLEILVWLLQINKQVKIEQLAARFTLPIKYENRRQKIHFC